MCADIERSRDTATSAICSDMHKEFFYADYMPVDGMLISQTEVEEAKVTTAKHCYN